MAMGRENHAHTRHRACAAQSASNGVVRGVAWRGVAWRSGMRVDEFIRVSIERTCAHVVAAEVDAIIEVAAPEKGRGGRAGDGMRCDAMRSDGMRCDRMGEDASAAPNEPIVLHGQGGPSGSVGRRPRKGKAVHESVEHFVARGGACRGGAAVQTVG
jgi:hypothetical protein